MSSTHVEGIQPEFDPQSESYEAYHDTTTTWEATTTLVLSLSSLTGVEPTQMRPLSYAVDPDVVNAHVRGQPTGATLSFEFEGHHVDVHDDGRFEFTPVRDRATGP